MSLRKPLVLDDTAKLSQLQLGDDVDVPLRRRVAELEENQQQLAEFLVSQDIEVPEELLG